jgi:hypothetical protein
MGRDIRETSLPQPGAARIASVHRLSLRVAPDKQETPLDRRSFVRYRAILTICLGILMCGCSTKAAINPETVLATNADAVALQTTSVRCADASVSGSFVDLCTASISGPAPVGGARVALTTSSTIISIPPAVLVHESTTSAQFTITGPPAATEQSVLISASSGGTTKSFVLTISEPTPRLSANLTALAFGAVPTNTPLTKTLTLRSSGTAPLTITNVTSNASSFSSVLAGLPVVLDPGQQLTMTVQFMPMTQGTQTAQLVITSDSADQNQNIVSLSGEGTPQLLEIACSSAIVLSSSSDSCWVSVSGPASSGGYRVGLTSSSGSITLPPAALVQANATKAQFTLSAKGVAIQQDVVLTATAGGISRMFSLDLKPLTPRLTANTPSLDFGNVPLQAKAVRSLLLTSEGNAPLTIKAVTAAGQGLAVLSPSFPIVLPVGQVTTITVLFTPAVMGLVEGQLSVSSDSSSNLFSVISVSGNGTATGTFSYSGSPLDGTLVRPGAATPIAATFFGMTIHHTSTPYPQFPVASFRFWDVAAWSTIEPTNGNFDWTHVDNAIRLGKINGTSDYIFTFGSVPGWASTSPTALCTGGDGLGSCAAPDMAALDNATTQLVQRYCGTIKYYETWNEPDNIGYWEGTNEQLLTIAEHIYAISKDPRNCGCKNDVCSPGGGVNPNQVLMPSIGSINTSSLAWLDKYLASAGALYPYSDIATFHGYHTTRPEDVVSQVKALRNVLEAHLVGSPPIWNTEGSWGPATGAVGQEQASWLMRYHTVLAMTGVSRFIWYAYDDCALGTLWEAPWCVAPQIPISTVTQPGAAYGTIEKWLSGATGTGCQHYVNGLWACELVRNGGFDAWMVWSSSGESISVPMASQSQLSYYLDWKGALNPTPSVLMITDMPVLLENQPL